MTCPAPRPRPRPAPILLLGVLTAVLPIGNSRGGEPSPVDFSREVRPILAKHCFACHGPDEGGRKAGLRLDRREEATSEREGGIRAIVPGSPDESELVFRAEVEDETLQMPPRGAGERLSTDELATVRRWIEDGAPYSEHWAFVAPTDPAPPAVSKRARGRDGIDRFILARLEREGIEPSPEADRAALLRRLSLDLRGLPPTPGELAAFLDDDRPDAYERAVDRFLADPAFGEKWARMWLDLARYADSAGLGSDPLRPDMWRYRNWVIDAFNRDLPYDRFTVEQIAGDLLPDPTLEQRVATAFHRNTMTNTEGGTDDEEFRVAAVKDRVDTTGQVWMGLTFGCAKCHSHKYDPISHEDYYSLFAIFNQTEDDDQPDERPTIPAPTAMQRRQIEAIDQRIAALRTKLDTTTPELAEAQANWETELARRPEWVAIGVDSAKAESGSTLERLEDGSFRVSGDAPAKEVYTIEAEQEAEGLVAFRLEAIPDPAFEDGGSGRAKDGNFVLSRFGVEVAPASGGSETPIGRFVRVELPGSGKPLSLAEVQAFSGGENAATTGKASQSSVDYEGEPGRAIDGNTDGHYFDARSTTHTKAEKDPWWEVELPEPSPIDRVVIWNRTDGGTGDRLAGFRVSLLDADRKTLWETTVAEPPAPSRELSPTNRRAVELVKAVADFEQGGFSVADAIRPMADPGKGWAVAPKWNEPHAAVFLARSPIDVSGPARLTFRLEHAFRDPGYSLGRLRISATRDELAARRAGLPEDVLAALDTPEGGRTEEQKATLARHYRSIAPELKPVRDEIATLGKSKPDVAKLPVMVELPAEKHRATHLMNKGNFLDPGKEVSARVPGAFHDLPDGSGPDRLGLARWLVDGSNPLTARVAVNRLWARLFGTGLVATEEDFGTQGEPPSHPELLDWLAIRFVESGWDTKAMIRRIVTSATYRQSSRVTPEMLATDPTNRLLAHAPRIRLEAEAVRDQALALSGLLCRKVGGPSVYPPQPEGLWQAAFNGQRNWSTSEGPDRYRRGIYTFWRRTVPYPSMAAFDAPSRELCTLRRVPSNTPLQAFVTLNDPVFVEAAQALGRRIMSEGGSSPEERARFGLTLCLARPATEAQVGVIRDLYRSELERYRDDPEAARKLSTEPLGPLPPDVDPAEAAAWTAVANVLLNLDGVLTKG
jgi:hypothetical protein